MPNIIRLMTNFYKILNASSLNKIFDQASDRLIVLMVYSKDNVECRRALAHFEKSASNHLHSVFCLIDIDKFEGNSRYINTMGSLPKFESYFMDDSLGYICTSNPKEIESHIASGENYMMSQLQKNKYNANSVANQVRQQILNEASFQNPKLYQHYLQNPNALQQAIFDKISHQQYIAPQNPVVSGVQPTQYYNPAINQPQMQPPQPQPQMPQMPPQPMQPQIPQQTLPLQTLPQISTDIEELNKMQQMFKIFTMLHKIGALNMPDSETPQNVQDNTSKTKDTIILPNGDKLIPLPDGKFGLVKNKQ